MQEKTKQNMLHGKNNKKRGVKVRCRKAKQVQIRKNKQEW